MARTPLKLVRRFDRAPAAPAGRGMVSAAEALTAASAPINDPSKSLGRNSAAGADRSWQSQAWDAYNNCGELRYYVGWRASSVSRCRLVASEIDPETGLPTGGLTTDAEGNMTAEGAQVAELVRNIAGGRLGQSQLQKRTAECLTVPGELWHVIIRNTDPKTGKVTEKWYGITASEITVSTTDVTVTLPNGEKHTIRRGVDVTYNVWNPHARKASEPDSPVRACLDSLHEIRRTTKTIANASKSRLIGNGIVFVPNQMSLPSMDAPVSSDKPGDPIVPLEGSPAVQQLQELLFQVASAAYDDEDSLAALIPMFAAVDAADIKNVHHLKFDNEVTEVAIKTRNDAIARLAMGLDVSPERLLGLGKDSNHWSAWQIADEDVRLHIAPVMETMCQALNEQVLAPILRNKGIDPEKYMVWYDASDLTADPDKTEEATNAFDRGAITAEAYREFLGLGETGYDLLNGGIEEWQKWAADALGKSKDPAGMLKALPKELLPAELQELDWPEPPPAVLPPGADPNSQPGDDETDGEEEPATERTSQTAAAAPLRITARQPDDAFGMAVDIFARRALQLAGGKMRTRANRDRLVNVDNMHVHRFVDPVPAERVDDLIKGWDSLLDRTVLRNIGVDPDLVAASVRRIAHEMLTRSIIEGEVI